MFLVTVLDDNNYRAVGFDGSNFEGKDLGDQDIRGDANPTKALHKLFIITGSVNAKYDYKHYIAAVPNGFLNVYALYYNLEPDLVDGVSYTYTPYYVTPDNIKVWQQTRSYTLGGGGKKLTKTYDTGVVTNMLADAIDKIIRPIISDSDYNSKQNVSNNNNNSSNQSSSTNSSSSGSGGSTSTNNSTSNANSNTSTNNEGTAANTTTNGNDNNQTEQANNGVSNTNNQSNSGSADPNSSLEDEKQSGEMQQEGDSWTGDEDEPVNTMNTWWIWVLAAAGCGFIWFIIWKRRKDDEEEA